MDAFIFPVKRRDNEDMYASDQFSISFLHTPESQEMMSGFSHTNYLMQSRKLQTDMHRGPCQTVLQSVKLTINTITQRI